MRTICLLLSFCLRVLMTKYTLAQRETHRRECLAAISFISHAKPRLPPAPACATPPSATRIFNSMNTYKQGYASLEPCSQQRSDDPFRSLLDTAEAWPSATLGIMSVTYTALCIRAGRVVLGAPGTPHRRLARRCFIPRCSRHLLTLRTVFHLFAFHSCILLTKYTPAQREMHRRECWDSDQPPVNRHTKEATPEHREANFVFI